MNDEIISDSEEDHLKKCFEFEALNLKPEVLRGIREAGFEKCTPIQAMVLPYSLEGKDVVGKAQTGTGKTAAFLLTFFQRLNVQGARPAARGQSQAVAEPLAVVMAPTRELAMQIANDGKTLGQYTGFRFATIIGGVEYDEQLKLLAENPEVVVATPGRLIDFLKSNRLRFQRTQIVVIDEADRMFDMGFYPDIKYLMRKMPPYDRRQTLLFSATMSYRVTELSYEFMNGPVEIDVSPTKITTENVEEALYHVGTDEKLNLLLGLLSEPEAQKIIIFTNTKSGAQWLEFKLRGNGHAAEALIGDFTQQKRLAVVRRFKDGQTKILVATDVASRGLHIDDVTHVVNFDVPEDPENYVHRIGRTARAGRSGKAIIFACERFVENLPRLEEYVSHKIPVQWYEDHQLKPDMAGIYRREKKPHGQPHRQGGRPGGNRPRHGAPQGRQRHGRKGQASQKRR